jgi:hypothetical protein
MAKDPKSSEPFVSQQDRPNVTADTPLSELRVRDLHQVLAGAAQLKITDKSTILDKTHKDFEKLQIEKSHFKELIKDTDNKHFKDIIDQIILKQIPESPPDPRTGVDPSEHITRLQNSVNQLANEVAQLKDKVGR